MNTLQNNITHVCQEMNSFLMKKNKSYGNSVAEPVKIFAKDLDVISQIDVRIDDKLSRLKNGFEYKNDDTIKDLTGYLLLRMAILKTLSEPQPDAVPVHDFDGLMP